MACVFSHLPFCLQPGSQIAFLLECDRCMLAIEAKSDGQKAATGRVCIQQFLLLRSHILHVCVKTRACERAVTLLQQSNASVSVVVALGLKTQTDPLKKKRVEKERPHYHISCCYFPISSALIRLQVSQSLFLSKTCGFFPSEPMWTWTWSLR